MDLLFLGTSSGTPTKTRNVSGLALLEESGKGWYLIDCGEATQHQLLRTPLTLHGLRAVLITHVHGDHCFGLPGLLASAGMAGRQEPLDIIAPAAVESWLHATFEMSQGRLPYELRFHATETFTGWHGYHFNIDATPLSHRVPSWGYRFTEARPDPRLDTERLDREGIPRSRMWGDLARGQTVEFDGRTLRSEEYLQATRPPRRIVIAGDNDRPELLADTCRDAQVLVHEATYTQPIADKAGETFGHSTAAGVATFAEAIGMPNLVLTHFSARYQADTVRGLSIENARIEAAEHYQGALFLAHDFARFRLARDGTLSLVAPQRRVDQRFG